jgi:hypothetical protein
LPVFAESSIILSVTAACAASDPTASGINMDSSFKRMESLLME